MYYRATIYIQSFEGRKFQEIHGRQHFREILVLNIRIMKIKSSKILIHEIYVPRKIVCNMVTKNFCMEIDYDTSFLSHQTVRRALTDGSKQQSDSMTLTIICHDFRIIKLTFTAMGTSSQQPVTQFTELGDPVAAASNYKELKNEGSLIYCVLISYCVRNCLTAL